MARQRVLAARAGPRTRQLKGSTLLTPCMILLPLVQKLGATEPSPRPAVQSRVRYLSIAK
jgi:hypothetical protein